MLRSIFVAGFTFGILGCGQSVWDDAGTGVDGGRLFCRSGEVVSCGCSNGLMGVQRCSAGVFAACSCENNCVPGRSESCTCSDGSSGARYCDSTGQFGTCRCNGSDASVDAGPIRDAGTPDACTRITCAADMCGVVPDGCGSTIDCGACTAGVQTLGIAANHIVFDASRNRLYATVGESAPRYANSLVIIDAATGSVADAIPVGSDPHAIALSDDSSTLWIGIDGAGAVRSLDVASMTPGVMSALPRGVFGDYGVAGDIVVLPGSRTSIALNIHDYGLSPSLQGTAVLDDGVARPTQAPGHTGASSLTGGPIGYLYGFNYAHTGFEFFVLPISASGLTQTAHSGLVSGFDARIVYSDSYVFATDGAVIDVHMPTDPRLTGHIPQRGPVAPDVAHGVAYVIGGDMFSTGPRTLYRYDLMTFTSTGSASVGMFGSRSLRDLVIIGTNRFAVVGTSGGSSGTNELYLLTPALP